VKALGDGGDTRAVVEKLARDVHYISLGSIASRILTVPEISELFGVSENVIRDRLKHGRIEPVKEASGIRLYALEQVPQILTAHLDKSTTTVYVLSRVRKAVRSALHASRKKIIQQRREVKDPTWYRQATVWRTIRMPKSLDEWLVSEAVVDGWASADHLIRALCVEYYETWFGRKKQ
jgi:predicted site-specific integrase-resolvase